MADHWSPAQSRRVALVRLLKVPLVFAALHVHLLLVGILWESGRWRYGGFW